MASRSPRRTRGVVRGPVGARDCTRALRDFLTALFRFRGRYIFAAERSLAGQQLEEQNTQGVHVTDRGDRLAADLFGAGVLRRQRPRPAGDRIACRTETILAQQLGDPEVEQLRATILGHQDVAGLEVAMDDQILVRRSDGIAHLAKQGDSLAHRQTVTLTVRIDRFSLHVLHDEERQTRRRRGRRRRSERFRDDRATPRSVAHYRGRRRASALMPPCDKSLMATSRRKASSSRMPRYTTPMPPRPTSSSTRYGPSCRGGSGVLAGGAAGDGTSGASMKPDA